MTLEIKIPIDDWKEEALENETPITDEDTILSMLDQGLHSGQVARMTLAWRAMGECPDDILKPNKVLLYAGAQEQVSLIARAKMHPVETEKGLVFNAHDYIGAVANGEEEEESYIHYTNKKALKRASNYLEKRVPGHIWPRLLLMYENGGDIKAAVRELKIEIDDMVKRLE